MSTSTWGRGAPAGEGPLSARADRRDVVVEAHLGHAEPGAHVVAALGPLLVDAAEVGVARGDLAFHKYMVEASGYKGRANSVHFRLDDDDAVSVNFIARLREVTRILSPSTHVTFPTGIFVFPASATEAIGVSMVQQRFLTAIGLATVNGPSFTKNPFQMMHGNVWTRWPVVSDPSFCANIRSQHFENDSGALQDRILGALQKERNSRRGRRHASAVDRRLSETFPWIDRETLDGLIGRCDAVKSMADLPPVT